MYIVLNLPRRFQTENADQDVELTSGVLAQNPLFVHVRVHYTTAPNRFPRFGLDFVEIFHCCGQAFIPEN
jgi:hypothetical protein